MSLSHDLQDIVADISAKIAASERPGRADLEILRRNLEAATRAASKLESDCFSSGIAFQRLADGVDAKVADLSGLTRHARSLVPVNG